MQYASPFVIIAWLRRGIQLLQGRSAAQADEGLCRPQPPIFTEGRAARAGGKRSSQLNLSRSAAHASLGQPNHSLHIHLRSPQSVSAHSPKKSTMCVCTLTREAHNV